MAGRAHGRNTKVYIDTAVGASGSAVPVSYLNTYTIDQSTDTVEVTAFGDTTKTFVTGLPGASGTMAGFVNMGTPTFSTLNDGNARKMYLYPDAVNTAGTYFFCTAYFSSSYDAGVGDAIKVSISWEAASSAAWVAGV